MTISGIVKNGVVVLDEGHSLPEGASVQVVFPPVAVRQVEGATTLSIWERLALLGREVEALPCDLPEDLAINHDYYLYGGPKRWPNTPVTNDEVTVAFPNPMQLARRNYIAGQLKDILAMFDALTASYAALSDKSGIVEEFTRFNGFDANDEEEFEFLKVGHEMSRLRTTPLVWDSHRPQLRGYLAMLDRWQRSGDQNKLTREDILRITIG